MRIWLVLSLRSLAQGLCIVGVQEMGVGVGKTVQAKGRLRSAGLLVGIPGGVSA